MTERSDLQQTAPARAPELRELEWPVERIIVPAKRRLRLRDVYGQAAFIRVLATRDFKVKYKQSLLGPLWLVFQPLALLAAFLVAFKGLGKVQSSGVPYVVFSLVGLSVWAFFQASMTIGAAAIISNANFVRYTPSPRPAFPLAGMIASLPSFGVTAAAAVVASVATGHVSYRIVLLPVGLLWLMVLTSGLIGIASALAVRYRDMISALPFLLQIGVFFAPVGYSLAALSPAMRTIVELNPLTGVIEACRWIMLNPYSPSVASIVVSLCATVVICVAGWMVFSRLETTMADEI